MKNKKRLRIHFSYFDNEKTEHKLRDMAAQGWILAAERHGKLTKLVYVRDTPRQLHYSIIPSPNLNQDAQELDDLCAQAGWELLAVKRRFRIYVNAQEDPVPIYTDPQDNMDKYKKFIWRRILTVGGLELAADAFFILWYAVMMRFELFSDSTELMFFPLGFRMWTAFLILLLLFICYLAALLIPLWRGMRALKKGYGWERKVRRSEKSSRWVQIIAPLVLIPAALLACTDAIDWPFQFYEPMVQAEELGYENVVDDDVMTWKGPLFRFCRYKAYVADDEIFDNNFFYVYLESDKDGFVRRLAESGVHHDEWIEDAPRFSRDGIDVYYFTSCSKIYMVKENQALYIREIPDLIQNPEMFDRLVNLFFSDHAKI